MSIINDSNKHRIIQMNTYIDTYKRRVIAGADIPELIRMIPDPPEKLWIEGELPDPDTYRYLCVVGSRRHSAYGRQAVEELVGGLAGHNICIVSGLALGIDSIAHRAALDAGLPTIAFPGSGLDRSVLYPQPHLELAEDILSAGGALVSEFEPLIACQIWTFPQRNRLMAAISHATLIIEAGEASGTLITARLALDYNRDVLALPGQIFSPLAFGPNRLIRDGAIPVTSCDDILEALGLPRSDQDETKIRSEKGNKRPSSNGSDDTENLQSKIEFPRELTSLEKEIVDIIISEHISRDEIIRKINTVPVEDAYSPQAIIAALSLLELDFIIKERGGKYQIC